MKPNVRMSERGEVQGDIVVHRFNGFVSLSYGTDHGQKQRQDSIGCRHEGKSLAYFLIHSMAASPPVRSRPSFSFTSRL